MKKTELFFAFILLPVDIAMVIASFLLSYLLRGRLEIGNLEFSSGVASYLLLSLYFLPLIIAIYAINGLYYTKINSKGAFELFKIFESNSFAMAVLVLILFFTQNLEYSRIILVVTWLLGIILVLIGRKIVKAIQNSLLKYGIGTRNLIIIGANELARFTAREIKKDSANGYLYLGAISASSKSEEMKILGKITDYKEIIAKYHADEIVVCEYEIEKSLMAGIMDFCSDQNITVKYIPAINPDLALKSVFTNIGSLPVMEIKMTPLDGWGRIIKRLSDVLFSVLLMIILSPIFLLVALLVKITSKGPVLYSHQRVGRDGKNFMLHKFRSMHHNSEKLASKYWTEKNDNRITAFGRFLRITNLDELPQFYNILMGDMSFVGPRPEQPKFVEKFQAEVPGYLNRHRVKSGLTGWAQVNGLKGDTSIPERVRYDMYYVENWSLWFDLKIVLMTVWIIIFEIIKGKYEYRVNS